MLSKFTTKPLQSNIDRARASLLNDKNNAVAYVYPKPKCCFKGVLRGVPVTIKDNFATKDAPTCASSGILKGFRPGYNATVVSLLKAAGATIVGKTNLDELALGGTGLHSVYGTVKHPLDKTRIVGGSSSGSAASFNSFLGVAVCSDTGDSTRVPASYVGAVGFKPSYGAVSRFGLFAYASSLDTVGWITHSVQDSIVVAGVLTTFDKQDLTSCPTPFTQEGAKLVKPFRVAYFLPESTASYIKKDFKKLVCKLRADKVQVQKITFRKALLLSLKTVYQVISYAEMASNDSNLTGLTFGRQVRGENWVKTVIKSRQQGFGVLATQRMVLGSLFLNQENQTRVFEKAQRVRRVIATRFKAVLKNFDVLLLPTTPTVAPKITAHPRGVSDIYANPDYADSLMLFANLSGTPSLSVPLGQHNGLPFAVNLNALPNHDEKLLRIGLYFEKLCRRDVGKV